MVLLIQCTDKVGLIANISQLIADTGLNIIAMREYVNTRDKRFYMRLEIDDSVPVSEKELTGLKHILPDNADIILTPTSEKKIAVLVTKEYHCLGDILLRNYFKTLGASVQCVIGNHDILQNLTERFNIPFHYIPHDSINKDEFEYKIGETLAKYQFDYIVLAKFMRILSSAFVEKYRHRIINIHHSFLPAFIGANPYRQAHERGVKLIGATAHFVTNDLDEGPIIAQQTIPVNHAHSVKDMISLGREIEQAVLAKALQLVMQDRVMIDHNKTIVFDN